MVGVNYRFMPAKEEQEGQDGPVSLTWVPDKWPLGGAIFFYLWALIWTSQLDTSNKVLSQLAFLFRRSWK